MPTPLKLKTYTEIMSAMFNTSRSLLGMGVDLNRGSVIRTVLEASALQDSEQYVQIGRLTDLFSIDTCFGEDLDRRALDFGLVFDEELGRFGAMTSIGHVIIGDSNLQPSKGIVEFDVAAGDTSFSIFQNAAPNDFLTIASSSTFFVKIGRPDINQQETVLVSAVVGGSPTELVCTILSPLTGLQFLHRAGENVRLATVATQVAAGILAGATSVTVLPGTGSIFIPGDTIILDRDAPSLRESRLLTGVVGDTLSWVAPTGFAHATGSMVIKSTVGSDRALGAGISIFVPVNFGTQQVDFVTTEASTLLDGDRETQPIAIESKLPGAGTRAASNTIIAFQSKPFPTATVINPDPCIRGRDRELDTQYKIRLKKLLQSLSRSTRNAIEVRVQGLLDPTSQKVVEFAQVQEPVGYGVSILYITDGSATFVIDVQVMSGREVLISSAKTGDRRARLQGNPPYAFLYDPLNPGNTTPRLFKSLDRGTATAVGANSLTDTNHVGGFPGAYIGYWLKTDDNQFYLITNAAGFTLTLAAGGATPSLGDYAIFNLNADPLKPSISNPPLLNEDYIFDQTTGNLELILANALTNKDALIVADDTAPAIGKYTQTIGLGTFVQKVVNGVPSDFKNFPGIKAAGTQVFVKAPNIVIPTFVVQIVPADGFTDDQLLDSVRSAVERIVNSGGIGQQVILSDIIVEVKKTTGLKDAKILSPSDNIQVLPNELVRITAANITIV